MKQLVPWYACFLLLSVVAACATRGAAQEPLKVAVTLSGGHETDPRDNGRPVVLIAAALGVNPEVFRNAFIGVRPAENEGPTKEDAKRTKKVLFRALQPFGITKERLDAVLDYYRYQPGSNLWKTTLAKVYAAVEGGKVKRIVITDPGSGYISPPTAAVQGMEDVKLKVTLRFSQEFKDNGAVGSVEVLTSAHNVEREPNSSDDFFFRGLKRQSSEDIEGAIADFTKTIEIDETELSAGESDKTKTKLAVAYCLRGEARIQQKSNYDSARSDLDRAILLNPTYVRAYQARALLRQILKDPEGAKSDAARVTSLINAKPSTSTKSSSVAAPVSMAAGSDAVKMMGMPSPEDFRIPVNAKIYLALTDDDFGKEVRKAFDEKKIQIVLVTVRSEADFEIWGWYRAEKGHSSIQCGILGGGMPPIALPLCVPYKVRGNASGHLYVVNLRTGHEVWSGTAYEELSKDPQLSQEHVADKLALDLQKRILTDAVSK